MVRAFGGVRAVDGATLDVEAGSITGLIGPNGAGKSTLFNCISGFLRPQSGTVLLDGKRIEQRSPYRIARAGLVRTFQTPRALTRMTVLENVMLAAPRQRGERLGRGLAPSARRREREVRARALELLELVRLDGHADALAGTLSGGQRKLLDLVRALMVEPRILLLDEPMAGVSPTLRVELLEHILALRDRDGVTLLIVEHDLDFVMRASDRVIVMNDGQRDRAGNAGRGASRRARRRRVPRRPPRGRMSLLEVDALEAGYDDAVVLRGVSLHADAHEIVAVIGPNGAGKSTLLKAVYGLVTRNAGSVRFAGEDVTGLRPDRLTRRGLNFVPQTDNVFPSLTVAENVHVSALVRPEGGARAPQSSASASSSRSSPSAPRQRAGTLSGGQRKLVALARALVTQPEAAAPRRAVRRALAAGDGDGLRQAASRSTRSGSGS